MPPSLNEQQPITSPVEGERLTPGEGEAQFLRARAAETIEVAKNSGERINEEQAIAKAVVEYTKSEPAVVLHESAIVTNPEFEKILVRVDTLPHQEKMRELYTVLAEKGILNTLKVVSLLNNPHVEEDFHHVIVQYVHSGKLVPGLDKERALAAELKRRVFELRVPLAREEGKVSSKQVRASMERFLSAVFMNTLPSDQVFSFEISNANFSTEVTFFAAVPDMQVDNFVKQFLGNFPSAQVTEVEEDYNLFNEFGVHLVAEGIHEKRFAFALADPGEMESLAPILASFNQMKREGEGMAVQYIVRSDDHDLLSKTRSAIGKIRDGVTMYEATDIPLTFAGNAFKFVGSLFGSNDEKPAEISHEDREKRDREVRVIEEKVSAPFLRVDMRLVVSAGDIARAEQLLSGLTSSFGQFTNRETSGGIRFNTLRKGGPLAERIHAYTFREESDDALVLNHKEFAALFHPPLAVTISEAPNVAEIKASTAPAPGDLPLEGTLLGYSTHRGERREIRMTKQDRLRHFYVIGQTGTGKTSILKNMIVEEIKAGHGVCFIDPHGSDVQDILGNIPPERLDDVIYIDPTYTERPFGLNMLEYDVNKPEQKIFVVNELLAIFKRLYASSPESMGPAFEQYFRNATMLVMESPELGNTLIDIMRVLVDKEFRERKLAACKNPIVTQFWTDMASKTTGDAGLQNMAPYIVNKFDVFISNDVMRPIVAQEKSSFNFRDIMDSRKIFLVNLAKGKLGEMNSNLIGLIIIGKFLLAAMSRVDSFGEKLPDFYLYVDEFQNVTTPSISAILSEARKYGLSLNLAHQFLAQLPDDIKSAVFGNVGSMAVFRVGVEDAQFFEEQLKPTFTAGDVQKIQNYNAYMKVLVNGKPVPPFSIVTAPPPKGNPEIVEKLKQFSFTKYGRDRATVDREILARYAATSAAQKKPIASTASASAQGSLPRPQSALQAQQAMARPVIAPQFAQAPYPQGQAPQMPPQMAPQFPSSYQGGYPQVPPQYMQGQVQQMPQGMYPQMPAQYPQPYMQPQYGQYPQQPQMYSSQPGYGAPPVAYPHPSVHHPQSGYYPHLPPSMQQAPQMQPQFPPQYHPQTQQFYPPQQLPRVLQAETTHLPQQSADPHAPAAQPASVVPEVSARNDTYREEI